MRGEALRASIEAEGRARIEALLRDAELRAQELRSAARDETARRRRALLAREEARLRAACRARVAAARAGALRRVLVARDSLLERVFERARQHLAEALETPKGQAQLAVRARRALAVLPEGEVRIVCSTGLAPALERVAAERSGLRIECDPELPAGFRAEGGGGALIVDATLERLLDLSRPTLAIELLRRIDAEEPM